MNELLRRIYKWLNVRKYKKIINTISDDNEVLIESIISMLSMLSTLETRTIPYHEVAEYRVRVRTKTFSEHIRMTNALLSAVDRRVLDADQIFDNKGRRQPIRLEAWLVDETDNIYDNGSVLGIMFNPTMELMLSVKETATISPTLYTHYLHLLKPYLYEVIDIIDCIIAAQLDIKNSDRYSN